MSSIAFPRRAALAASVVAAGLATGCAQIKLGAPVATIENIQRAKASGMGPAALGEFALDPARPKAMDAGIDVRSNTVSSPFQDSFAQYLKEALAAELRAAGLLDPGTDVVIRGWLTESRLDAAITQGSGAVAARFVVARAGLPVYDRQLRATATWDSSFIGAVAIPAAVNHYSALYRQLVGQLLEDPAFKAAVARPARAPM